MERHQELAVGSGEEELSGQRCHTIEDDPRGGSAVSRYIKSMILAGAFLFVEGDLKKKAARPYVDSESGT
jgi:hypothetical protein